MGPLNEILRAGAQSATKLLTHLLTSLHNLKNVKLIAEIKYDEYEESSSGTNSVEYTTILSFEEGKTEVNTIESAKLRKGGNEHETSC